MLHAQRPPLCHAGPRHASSAQARVDDWGLPPFLVVAKPLRSSAMSNTTKWSFIHNPFSGRTISCKPKLQHMGWVALG